MSASTTNHKRPLEEDGSVGCHKKACREESPVAIRERVYASIKSCIYAKKHGKAFLKRQWPDSSMVLDGAFKDDEGVLKEKSLKLVEGMSASQKSIMALEWGDERLTFLETDVLFPYRVTDLDSEVFMEQQLRVFAAAACRALYGLTRDAVEI
ncbi:MAG: hypothetical protein VYE81_05920 [Planctomycetota bacterium]|nr:hypothetical protein [Planctomycetota bacterium]